MSANTATWQIPFPTGQDRFCDGYLYTQRMAERVDTLLHAYEVDFDLLDDVPAAKLSLSETKLVANINSDPAVHWDQIEYDTSNLVNLALDNTVIRYDRNGYWAIGSANDFVSSPSTAGAQYTAALLSTSSTGLSSTQQGTRDNGNSVSAKSAYGGLNLFTTNDVLGLEGKINMESRTSAGTAQMFIASPGMTACWVREI